MFLLNLDVESERKREMQSLGSELETVKERCKSKEEELDRYKRSEIERDDRLRVILSSFFNELKTKPDT